MRKFIGIILHLIEDLLRLAATILGVATLIVVAVVIWPLLLLLIPVGRVFRFFRACYREASIPNRKSVKGN